MVCPRCGSKILLVDHSDKVKAVCPSCHYVVKVYVLIKMPKLTKICLISALLVLFVCSTWLTVTDMLSWLGHVILYISTAVIFVSALNLIRVRT